MHLATMTTIVSLEAITFWGEPLTWFELPLGIKLFTPVGRLPTFAFPQMTQIAFSKNLNADGYRKTTVLWKIKEKNE